MKTAAIICEYNPFHNGHAYHIQKTKEETGAEYIVALMSGNYVQRGTPAILEKQIRTQMALQNGADLVIELPLYFACGSAPYFASGSVSLLNHLGIIDTLSFGSECGNISLLKEISSFLLEYENTISSETAQLIKLGHPFPKAQEIAFTRHCPDSSWLPVIREPNNILGLEYLKALLSSKSSIKPFSLSRTGSGHHENQLTSKISSASAIRNIIEKEPDNPSIFSQIPENCKCILKEHLQSDAPVTMDDFSEILKTLLILHPNLTDFWEISSDFQDMLHKYYRPDITCTELIADCKSKHLTWTRISRNLLHIILNITKSHYQIINNLDYSLYYQILGFKKESSFLISEMKRNASVPMVRHLRPWKDALSPEQNFLLSSERQADSLYKMILGEKFGICWKDQQIIV